MMIQSYRFTPMLPEVTTEIIGTCHKGTPIRLVCNFEVLWSRRRINKFRSKPNYYYL